MVRYNIRYILFYSILLMLSSLSYLSAQSVKEPTQQSSKRLSFINAAVSYLNTPYRYGGRTKKGMDCSGLVCRCAADVLQQALPRRSDALAKYAKKIAESDIQPGDLLFFNTTGRISHAAVYIGAGKFIHSASDGPQTGVIISGIQEAYWKKAYRSAGRIIPAETIFTTEAQVPLFSRTEENCTLHPGIVLPK